MLYLSTYLGSSPSYRSEEAGQGVPVHHGEHGGGENCGEGGNEAPLR